MRFCGYKTEEASARETEIYVTDHMIVGLTLSSWHSALTLGIIQVVRTLWT